MKQKTFFKFKFKSMFICVCMYVRIMFLAKKYCAMLHKEDGVVILQKIASDKLVDPEVCELCYRILDLMNEFK